MAASLLAGPALAAFTAQTATEAHTVSSATLAAPTGLGAIPVCVLVPSSIKVDLSWTATSSTFADGYEIFRSATSGGPYSSIGTVSGRTTTTYADTTVTFSTTYHYVVQATRNAWRSVNSAQASVTTPNLLCL
ncbi:MAG: hypothetical protein ACRDN6_12715 [Gaiellaceae bacterium]